MIRRNLRPRTFGVGLLTLVTSVLISLSAVAQRPTPKVFMLPTQSVNDSISSIIPERIGEQVREGVKQDGRAQLMPSYDEVRKKLDGGGHASAAIAQAETLYTQGIGLLTAGENQKAAETFQRSVDMMEQNIADLSNYDVLADALANLSLSYFNAKFDLDARKRMKDFAHLRPTAKLDAEKYPKELLEVLADEQKKVASAGPGKLNMTVNVEGAKIFVDGVNKGVSPQTLTDIGFGTHYLVVRGPKGGVSTEKMRVKGKGKTQDFKIELGAGSASVSENSGDAGFYNDLLASVKTGRWGAESQPYLKELGSRTGAEFVGWLVMYKESSKYIAVPFMHRISDGMTVQLAAAEFNIELSNLRSGVSGISKSLVDATLKFPEDKAVVDVVLGPDTVVVAKAPPVETKTKKDDVVVVSDPYEGQPMQTPPDAPPSEEMSTWTYVAAGGAVIVAGALVAGGIYLLSDSGNSERAPGFDANISW